MLDLDLRPIRSVDARLDDLVRSRRVMVRRLRDRAEYLVHAARGRWPVAVLSHRGAAGDITQSFGTASTFTITLASLASSATWVAGQESTAVSFAAPAVDYLIGGKVRVGTSPTSGTFINVFAYGTHDGSTYADVLDGTDSAETFTSVGVRNGAVALLASLEVDSTTSDRDYFMRPTSLVRALGFVPSTFGLWVTHNTGVALNATGGNHSFFYRPVYFNVSP